MDHNSFHDYSDVLMPLVAFLHAALTTTKTTSTVAGGAPAEAADLPAWLLRRSEVLSTPAFELHAFVSDVPRAPPSGLGAKLSAYAVGAIRMSVTLSEAVAAGSTSLAVAAAGAITRAASVPQQSVPPRM